MTAPPWEERPVNYGPPRRVWSAQEALGKEDQQGEAAEQVAGHQPRELPLTRSSPPVIGTETACLPLFPTVPCDTRNLWMAVLFGGTGRETGTQSH